MQTPCINGEAVSVSSMYSHADAMYKWGSCLSQFHIQAHISGHGCSDGDSGIACFFHCLLLHALDNIIKYRLLLSENLSAHLNVVCVCVCACVYVCVCVGGGGILCVCAWACACMCIHACMHNYTCACMCEFTCVSGGGGGGGMECMCVCICVYVCMWMCGCKSVHMSEHAPESV